MTPEFDDSPEELYRLRTTVRDWLKKSKKALLTFQRVDNGSFWRDSNKCFSVREDPATDNLSATTTSRAYMALVYADRALAGKGPPTPPEWSAAYSNFMTGNQFSCVDNTSTDITAHGDSKPLNYFDMAHLADLAFVSKYLKRFYSIDNLEVVARQPDGKERTLATLIAQSAIDHLTRRIRDNDCVNGEVAFEIEKPDKRIGHHYFVTLHSLRSLAVLNKEVDATQTQVFKDLLETTRRFCVEQSFYSLGQRAHRHDVMRLTFAGVTYIMYSRYVDPNICMAIIEAIAKSQQDDGSWPATHPLFRAGYLPWHITSHELALCLTWLYFQPRIADACRSLLMQMMHRYFENWVVTTFTHVPKRNADGPFDGWFDDHTITRDMASGWVTAIVCHFLANYCDVLDNFINRRVIESLGLEASSSDYLIDENAHARSSRWSPKSAEASLATWPDLPPFSWQSESPPGDVARTITENWTDPSEDANHSKDLAEKILLPISTSPLRRPRDGRCAGILTGPPGTRKTSLVNAVSSILEWPRVTVPASVILERGWDLMEARANEVFRRLKFLSGCVIFFDEFEEFFRDRGTFDRRTLTSSSISTAAAIEASAHAYNLPNETIDGRTIAAFTTSAMLPRLQELHDECRCLIILATNYYDKLDDAICRVGRFDFELKIEHPTWNRAKEYLKAPTGRSMQKLGIAHTDALFVALSEAIVSAGDEVFVNPLTQVRFKLIEDAMSIVADTATFRDQLAKKAPIARKTIDAGDRDLWMTEAKKFFTREASAAAPSRPPKLNDLV